MFKIILIIYIILSTLLIITILLNKGKGSEIGATFDSSSDIFGSKGSNAILNKIIITIALMILIINILINTKNLNIKKNTTPNIDINKYIQ